MHLQARANGNPNTRSAKELFNDAVAPQIEGQFGVRRRLRSEEASRKRGVQDRMKASAASHGVDFDKYATDWAPQSRQPNLDAGEPVTPQTIQSRDRRDAGEGGEDLTPYRANAFQKFFVNRNQGTDRRPGAADVRLNRNADDGRYPDRRGAEAG
jgi:hypothetical protein